MHSRMISASTVICVILLSCFGFIQTAPAEAALADVGSRNSNFNGRLGYMEVNNSPNGSVKGSVGVADLRSGDLLENKLFTTGFEVGNGVMGRASIFDGKVHLGPADINMGVNADTGFLLKEGAMEAKVLGVGGKIGKDGFEICVGVCLGLKLN